MENMRNLGWTVAGLIILSIVVAVLSKGWDWIIDLFGEPKATIAIVVGGLLLILWVTNSQSEYTQAIEDKAQQKKEQRNARRRKLRRQKKAEADRDEE